MHCFDIMHIYTQYTINWGEFHSFAKIKSSRINPYTICNIFYTKATETHCSNCNRDYRGVSERTRSSAVPVLPVLGKAVCTALEEGIASQDLESAQSCAASQELINVTEPAQSRLEMAIWNLAISLCKRSHDTSLNSY